MTFPESVTYLCGVGIRFKELVLSIRPPGDADLPGTGEPDFCLPRKPPNELCRSRSLGEASRPDDSPYTDDMARGLALFLPPCETRLGMECASIVGSISNWYASSGLIVGLIMLRPEGGGDEGMDPRLLLRAPGRETASSMLRGVGGPPISSMLRTGDAVVAGLCARAAREGLSARPGRGGGGLLPSKRAMTSLLSSSSADSRDMVAAATG